MYVFFSTIFLVFLVFSCLFAGFFHVFGPKPPGFFQSSPLPPADWGHHDPPQVDCALAREINARRIPTGVGCPWGFGRTAFFFERGKVVFLFFLHCLILRLYISFFFVCILFVLRGAGGVGEVSFIFFMAFFEPFVRLRLAIWPRWLMLFLVGFVRFAWSCSMNSVHFLWVRLTSRWCPSN